MASKDGGRRKRRKSAKVDRISSLSDEVLSHILSFLPTKCAIGTSILSKRWKYLWTSITSFDLKGPSDEDGIPEILDFTNFVNKVFRSCHSSNIQKFRLHASWKDKTHVTEWIDEAVKRNVKEVDIYVHKLPLSILTCTTLSVLTLSVYGCYDENDVSFDLPCLKVLHIKKGCLSIGFIEKLISSSPVLEDLTLAGYLAYDNLIVSAPALKTLRLKRKLRADKNDPPTVSAIFIKAPSLGYLHLRNIFLNNIKGDFPSLVKAYVNMGVAFTWGRKKRGTPHCFATPKFHNLTCLEVITRNYRFWRALPKLIRSSPKLKVLSLKQKGLDGPVNDEYTWVEPKSVPLCFGSHLAVIKIKGLKGRNHELQLLKFCLGRAKALQSLSIRCRGLTEAEETQFCGQLLKFSRTSASCQIQFRGDIISNL